MRIAITLGTQEEYILEQLSKQMGISKAGVIRYLLNAKASDLEKVLVMKEKAESIHRGAGK